MPERPQEPTTPAIRVPANRLELGCSMVFAGMSLAWAATYLFVALGLTNAIAFMWLLPLILGLIWPIAALFHQSVTVGDDGVELESFVRKKFVPFSEVAKIRWFPGSLGRFAEMIPYQLLIIRLHSGETKLAWGFRPRIEQAYKDSAARFHWHRIRSTPNPPADLRRPADGGLLRIEELRKLTAREGATLRLAPIDKDALWDIALSPTAEASDRAAASIALCASANDAERRRLRVAADATANPRLRIAMDLALEPSTASDVLAMALAELDEADHEVRPRHRAKS